MKKILIVDHDTQTLSRISQELGPYNEFQILTAERTRQAARLLDMLPVDLLITEIDMPKINGFQLLVYQKKHFPELPVMAMANRLTPDAKNKLRKLGIERIFPKPVDVDLLTESIFEELNIVAAGRIHGISLASFLQLVDLEKKTCTLTVKSQNRVGKIYCQNGEVIASELGELRGKPALYQLMFWDRSIIEIQEKCTVDRRDIEMPLMYLLMESHQLRDETDIDIPDTHAAEDVLNTPPESGIQMDETDPSNISAAVGDSHPMDPFPEEAIQAPRNFTSLSEKLLKSPEIIEYAVIDKQGSVRTGHPSFPQSPNDVNEIIEKSAAIGEEVGSALKCLDLWTGNSRRYMLIPYRECYLVCRLKPGSRAMDVIRKYNWLHEVE